MARFTRMHTLQTIISAGMAPVFYNPDPEKVKKIAKACYDGGCRVIEFTNRGDMAADVYKELEKYAAKELPEMVLGVGSISDEGVASLYMQYGANFLVGQFFDPAVASVCNKRKVPYLPGCGTLSEIHRAEEAGVEICKLFPAMECGGPSFIKAVRGPSPWTSIMPTGGVTPDEDCLKEWISAGAVCVGMGSKLIPSKIPDDFDYDAMTKTTSGILETIRKIRANK